MGSNLEPWKQKPICLGVFPALSPEPGTVKDQSNHAQCDTDISSWTSATGTEDTTQPLLVSRQVAEPAGHGYLKISLENKLGTSAENQVMWENRDYGGFLTKMTILFIAWQSLGHQTEQHPPSLLSEQGK